MAPAVLMATPCGRSHQTNTTCCHWQFNTKTILALPNPFSLEINYVLNQTNTKTRSTRRAQASLAEGDHNYSHIAQCKNVEPWW